MLSTTAMEDLVADECQKALNTHTHTRACARAHRDVRVQASHPVVWSNVRSIRLPGCKYFWLTASATKCRPDFHLASKCS